MRKDFYNQTYFGNLLNGLSQFGNALVGGRQKLEYLIDWTFKPIEGLGHCLNAYEKDHKEDFAFDKGGNIGLSIMTIILIIFCIPLSVIF